VDGVTISDSKWALTRESLVKFLACLDSNTDRAGERYEEIRLRLVKFFDWRGSFFPDECADETINRVIRKLDSGETFRDIETYCLGVARLVFLETLRRPERRHTELDEALGVVAPATTNDDRAQAQQTCFQHCLDALPPESRHLILGYYQDEHRQKINNRQEMANRRGLSLNALRNRTQRIRERLERCIAKCLG